MAVGACSSSRKLPAEADSSIWIYERKPSDRALLDSAEKLLGRRELKLSTMTADVESPGPQFDPPLLGLRDRYALRAAMSRR